MIKTKEFSGGGVARIDEQINEFLQEGKRQLIDIKLTGVNNTFTTQCDYIALLIYREEPQMSRCVECKVNEGVITNARLGY